MTTNALFQLEMSYSIYYNLLEEIVYSIENDNYLPNIVR